ncbi:hypothetical protein K3165_04570 [Qipengyuania sp. 1XM1-15A]|uniref:TonB-dependent receptor plug domain-containing protein n=1 Tax=Qipengyuania xiamenensis TaxID=2867237 RepID=UPI001C879690|nr:hypothetical protein [Qipengyuania xiamenensis]MBX7532195.1 hypothetical protein [Qipengyuania xiamenensis]
MPLITAAMLLATQGTALQAQQAPEPEDEAPVAVDGEAGSAPVTEDGDIVVFGTRLKGQLTIDEPPLAEYNEADIAAFGASSIADVIAAIEPATGSSSRGNRGGGRPVFLINGIRVSSWREFRSYPQEAVAKVEVFSEEVAQRFGFSPDQRVVNIVLKPNFQSLTAEVEYEQPGIGGYSYNEQELTWLRIGEKGRLNFDVEVQDRSLLTEADRGLSVGGNADEAEFRSLVADTFSLQAEANYARAFIDSGTSLSLNGTFARSESLSLNGLATDGISVLERQTDTDSYSLGSTINKPLGDWNATFTTDANHTRSETDIDRFDASGFDTATSRTYTIANDLTLTGYPVQLPAGDLTMTFDAGLDWRRIESEDTRTDDPLSLTRRRVNGGVNINAPVLRRGGPVGGLSVNFSGGVEDLSDFGALANWSLGANWSPTETLNLSATRIWREVAPSLTNLGSPRIEELNQTVFDYSTGETVLATVISGGNPNLVAETQSDWSFGANWELPFWENARLQANYGINRSRDVTSTPSFSSAFEQAFPDRVTRDGAGELLAIDRRPLTLYQTRSRILSFGLNTRGQIGKAPERPERGEGRGGPPQGAASGQQRGGPGGGFDPSRMEAMRKVFCETPEGETPDLSQIPEMFRARLLDDAGNPDPEKIAAARERFCGEEADQRSERFAAMRTALCAEPPKLDGLPEQMLARLKGEDGEIDPEKLKAARERMCSTEGSAQQGQGSGRGGGRMARMFGGGNPGDTRPRYFLSLNHSITLENEVLLSEGGPLFDQLDGFVIGGGAIPEHSSRLEGGIFWQGYGMRLSGNYIGEAVLRGGDAPGASDLFYGDLATVDIRLFADLGEVTKSEDGWLKGLRVAVRVDNVFDARRSVVDGNGDVPEAFDPFRIDPTGRYLGIDVRKAF